MASSGSTVRCDLNRESEAYHSTVSVLHELRMVLEVTVSSLIDRW